MKKNLPPFAGIKLASVMWLLLSSLATAHDTNTTHPRLTIAAGELIKSDDEIRGAYHDLWKTVPEIEHDTQKGLYITPLWGQDPRFNNKTDKDKDEKAKPKDYPAFRHSYAENGKPRNTLDGVVMEDTPLNRVFSHFQHAYTGQAMHLDIGELPFTDSSRADVDLGLYGNIERSEDTAKRFFYDSVEIMGYLEDEKSSDDEVQIPNVPLSFWLFGHALHHAEDMSSIAHVHGDVHISKDNESGRLARKIGERDDYEAHYIPNKIYLNEAVWFEQASNIKSINDFSDIWGNPALTRRVILPPSILGNLLLTEKRLSPEHVMN